MYMYMYIVHDVCTPRVSMVPPMDWEKFLEEIELDVVEEPHRPSKSHNPQKEEDSSLT